MTTALVDRTGLGDEAQPGRRRRRALLSVATVLVLALLTAGVAVLSSKPHLTPGSFSVATPTSKVANDGYSDTKYVIDGGSGGVLHVSVRNPSRIPVTILGLATTPETPSSLSQISFESYPFAPGKGVGTPQPLVSSVTLGRGDEAGVLLQLRFPACIAHQKGFSEIYDAIPMRVRRLGVTRTVLVPLDRPLWVYATTDHPASGTCLP
jgi:hypothetical protein